jgi:hypothetical protein
VHLPRLQGWGEKPPVKNGLSLGGYGAVAMNAALTASMAKLPEQLRKTLTWDRGRSSTYDRSITDSKNASAPTSCSAGSRCY